ncbi:MAG: hypothetical protein GC191_08195 [Azospirillum sp.]|nr:hypothetical protein [Azospirillum sp.]
MTPLAWPADLRPQRMVFYIRSTARTFRSRFTGQAQTAAGTADRWVCELTVKSGLVHGRFLEALVAGRRGAAGIVLLSDCRYQGSRGTPQSFSSFADTIGETGFDDGFGFTDGHDFIEGSGSMAVLGGVGTRLLLGGLAPGSGNALAPGDMVQTGPARGHIVTGFASADIAGRAVYTIAPPLREAPALGLPETDTVAIGFRLIKSDPGRTRQPWRGAMTLKFEEAV